MSYLSPLHRCIARVPRRSGVPRVTRSCSEIPRRSGLTRFPPCRRAAVSGTMTDGMARGLRTTLRSINSFPPISFRRHQTMYAISSSGVCGSAGSSGGQSTLIKSSDSAAAGTGPAAPHAVNETGCLLRPSIAATALGKRDVSAVVGRRSDRGGRRVPAVADRSSGPVRLFRHGGR
jgi:hypothetical protein